MRTNVCEMLGIDVPIFAFTHCRDVVVEVSRAGGLGVLGMVGFSVEQVKEELDWIDAHIGDKPYGVDIVIPQKYEGIGQADPAQLEQKLKAMVPQGHHDFAAKILKDHGVPEWPDDSEMGLIGWTEATARPQLEEALKRPNVRLVANALGTPPQEVIDEIHASGRLVAALCGKIKQGLQHKAAGVDIIIAQGAEGGGHTGDIGSIVLWPQMVDAVAPTPVLAAGGVGNGRQMAAALAMGCAGVWTGSLWLTVTEAHAEPAQKEELLKATSEDTVRSRSWTGKPARMVRNDWTEAWEAPENPKPLGMPLQGLVSADAIRRTSRYAGVADTRKVIFNPCGQVIGQINQVESSKEVVFRLLNEYVDTLERLNGLLDGKA
ncbi:nitronate monooxygenase [Denitratisoma oestradiolicum]|uniref:Putative enzyme n=1 Tax=Denitratisoma oestradiolicum TaxID=311182 RepID=A0A6S6YAW6_9PROT|nr:nitronate monooxygenase family protein [Denitratisoma oestradiolicum]TWO79979.1 monooxygenase [Denitratisoma oestradiolicum]CAB1369742.1 putative enzyme [Denitratisoma oestradiolicum]